MTARSTFLLIALLLVAAWPHPGQAHAIRIFAAYEGAAIRGSVYLPGGNPLAGASVAASDQAGRVVARTATDDQGQFTLSGGGGILLLTAETMDGHRAEFTLAAPKLAPGQGQADAPPAAARSNDELRALIEKAVARQLNPLREQLDREAHRRRLQDILGGLGYIAGLAGLALYGVARKKTGKRD